MPKKIPIRQCVACREHREKPLLARVVRTPEGAVVYDSRGKVPGRISLPHGGLSGKGREEPRPEPGAGNGDHAGDL